MGSPGVQGSSSCVWQPQQYPPPGASMLSMPQQFQPQQLQSQQLQPQQLQPQQHDDATTSGIQTLMQ